MNCKQIEALLSPYLDGMVESEDQSLIEEHLRQCPACREELQQLQALQVLLRSLPELEMPETFSLDLRNKLQQG